MGKEMQIIIPSIPVNPAFYEGAFGGVSSQRQSRFYYLPKKNVAAHFDQLLLNDLPYLEKIGDSIKALQISKPAVQTASL